MRFRVRKPRVKHRALHWWHTWFAWHPVRTPTKGRMSGQTLVWLERVERKGKFWVCIGGAGWDWSYRGLNDERKES